MAADTATRKLTEGQKAFVNGGFAAKPKARRKPAAKARAMTKQELAQAEAINTHQARLKAEFRERQRRAAA